MRSSHQAARAAALLLVAPFAFGCQAPVGAEQGPGSGGSQSSSGGSGNLGGSAMLPSGTQAQALLPARIRRLTDAEYQASVSALVGSDADGISADFVPDSRQGGFTVNAAQRVDPVLARQLSDAASALAADVRQHAAERAPCADVAGGAEACATTFIRSFGEQAYRRPLGDDEVTQLLGVFHAAADDGSYEEGIELVARAMLQSPSFVYLTEIGAAPAATVELTPYEVASSISYLVQGRPPSPQLLSRVKDMSAAQVQSDMLADPSLFGLDAEGRVVRVVREWLGLDAIADTSKDSNVYPGFAAVKSDMERETSAFLDELVTQHGSSLSELLAADWTVADAPLAQAYGVSGPSDATFEHVATPGRRGILNQGAFLSVFAHAHETAPVLRGVAVMRRVACVPVGDPVDLTSAVVPPAPDPSKTTRERFAAHASPGCAACHDRIDSFGFAFEGFDGMGQARTTDNGQPVDTSVSISGTDFDGDYADSNALALALSQSPQVRDCFARHMFRAMAGTSADDAKASEDDFVDRLQQASVGASSDVSITDTLAAYVASPAFIYRRTQ